jgi:hypothetical protein
MILIAIGEDDHQKRRCISNNLQSFSELPPITNDHSDSFVGASCPFDNHSRFSSARVAPFPGLLCSRRAM